MMLLRKLFRTAWKYKAQFLSMIIMIAIGTGVFVGFHIEWYSLDKNTSEFFEDTNYADFRIYNELGFTAEDIAVIIDIDGIDASSRVLSVNVGVKNSEDALSLFAPEDYTVSKMLVLEGIEYDKDSDGFWLSDKYAAANGYKLGDTLILTYRGIQIEGEIVALIKSAEYTVCVADGNQLMPDYDNFGFVYASPDKIFNALGIEYYPQINIKSDLSKAEMESVLNDSPVKTTLLLSKDEHMAYAGPQSEIEEGQTMGSILPVLFLAIAILTMVTTMHRIAANEKTQIGTLKALGFRDRKILMHYSSYGLALGIIGSALGILLGFGIAGLIINPKGMMGTYLDMPSWKLYIPGFCTVILILTVLFLTLIAFLSVRKMLKGTAADALRPYTPKAMKAMKIENTRLWQMLPFGTKWNMRDLVRHKARSFMTLFGIVGCMLLLVGGLGMKDTMDRFLSLINESVNNYATRINITENANNEDTVSFAKEHNGDWLAASSIKIGDNALTLEIYDVEHDKIRFIDEDNNFVDIGDEGAYICLRLADDYKIGDTIEFSPYGEEETYTVKVAGVLRSVMTENITMTKEYAESVGIPYHISAVFTDESISDIADAEFISGKQSKVALMESYDSFMEIMNIMVWVFVLGAIVLGTVVLYNLGVMSYVERSRELATLKVVGFRDRHIGKILISQNIWLTFLGVLIGLPGGIFVLHVLITSLVSEYELKLTLGLLTYSVSILLTFGVSFVVGLFVTRKNKKIDMVEALKGAE
ncbi:MAG: ABC transporter permease [Lachnospiraceae bacterium]|nr:ABC transporter permease [Lachnospiraceae bacterium]